MCGDVGSEKTEFPNWHLTDPSSRALSAVGKGLPTRQLHCSQANTQSPLQLQSALPSKRLGPDFA